MRIPRLPTRKFHIAIRPRKSRLRLTTSPVLGLAKIRLSAARFPSLRRQRNQPRRQRRISRPRRSCPHSPTRRKRKRHPTPPRQRQRLRHHRPLRQHVHQPRPRGRPQRHRSRPRRRSGLQPARPEARSRRRHEHSLCQLLHRAQSVLPLPKPNLQKY